MYRSGPARCRPERRVWPLVGRVRSEPAGLMRRFAKELVGLNPDVLLTNAGPLLRELALQTETIPIVFVVASHPVEYGEAKSVARPGRNITGFPSFEFSMGGKWLGLLKEIAPSVVRAGIIFNPETASYAYQYLPVLEAAAKSLSVSVIATPVRDTDQLKRAVSELGAEPGGGLIVIPDTFTITHRRIMIEVAAQHRLPAYAFSYHRPGKIRASVAERPVGLPPVRNGAEHAGRSQTVPPVRNPLR